MHCAAVGKITEITKISLLLSELIKNSKGQKICFSPRWQHMKIVRTSAIAWGIIFIERG
jgi:hypothetical protein